jgi:hypothetical protein
MEYYSSQEYAQNETSKLVALTKTPFPDFPLVSKNEVEKMNKEYEARRERILNMRIP